MMKTKNDNRREVINKIRTNLLLSVDDEIRKRKNSGFKVNSMSQEEFLKSVEDFYMFEKNIYISSPSLKEFSFSIDKKIDKSNPLTPQKNSLDIKISDDISRRNSKHDLSISYVESTNNNLIKSDIICNKELIVKMYNQGNVSLKSYDISPVLKKKDFILELKNSIKDNDNKSHKAYIKLKQIVKSIKITKNPKNAESLNQSKTTTVSSRKSKPEFSILKENSIFNLKNDDFFTRRSVNSFKTLSIKPSYDLINNQLNNEFFSNFKNDLKKKLNDSINYSTNASSNNEFNNIGIVISEENLTHSKTLNSTNQPTQTNSKKLSLNYKPKLDVIKKDFMINLKKC